MVKEFTVEGDEQVTLLLKILFDEGFNNFHVDVERSNNKVFYHVPVEMDEEKAEIIESRFYLLVG